MKNRLLIIKLVIVCLFGLCLTKTKTITITSDDSGGVVTEKSGAGMQAESHLDEVELPTSSDEVKLRTENKTKLRTKLRTENKTNAISAYSELDSCHYPSSKGCFTASGKIARVGMVATNLYPFGTKLKIGNKIYIVEDRVSKKYNNRYDIFMGYGEEAHQEALKFGIQYLPVEIINN